MYGRSALVFERPLAHPVERVWHAVTDPEELAHWFPARVEGEVRAGGRLTFTFPDDALPSSEGEVTDFDPPRLLAFMWDEDHLRFELEPDGEGTVLRFTTILGDPEAAARNAAGWHVCLDELERRLAGESAAAPGTEATDRWRELYEDYQRRGLSAGAPVPGQD